MRVRCHRARSRLQEKRRGVASLPGVSVRLERARARSRRPKVLTGSSAETMSTLACFRRDKRKTEAPELPPSTAAEPRGPPLAGRRSDVEVEGELVRVRAQPHRVD